MSDIFNMADTWNAGGTIFSAIKMDVTDTASATGSMLMDLRIAGLKRLDLGKDRRLGLYNLYIDDSNWERGGITWFSNQMVVGAERAGTGTLRSLVLDSIQLQINISGSARWLVQAGTAHILASADNTNDIGASGANRPRNLYMASWIRMATTTVASLPAAATAAAGARMFVTDALNPVFGSAVTGGGAVTVPVYSTGSAWNVG